MQLPAPAKQLARLYSGVASDRRRNCTRLHRGCNDALLLGSRPSPALPNRSHYLRLRLRHWIAPHIDYLNLSITGASFYIRRQRPNVSSLRNPSPPSALPITGRWSPPRSRRHLQVIARSHVFAETTPRPKLPQSRYSCFALACYQPKFPEKIHGPSAPVSSSSP